MDIYGYFRETNFMNELWEYLKPHSGAICKCIPTLKQTANIAPENQWLEDDSFSLRIQVCPKDPGFPRTNPILFGWDWYHQSYSIRQGDCICLRFRPLFGTRYLKRRIHGTGTFIDIYHKFKTFQNTCGCFQK